MASFALSLFLLQAVDDFAATNSHYLLWITISVAVIALFFLLLMIGSLVGAIKMYGAVKRMELLAHRLEGKVNPIIAKTEGLMDDLSPKVRKITDNVVHISDTARSKSDEIGQTISSINATVADTNVKTRAHIDHVDGLISEALTTTRQVSQSVQNSIRVPVRQIAGIVAGVKTGLETWVSRLPFGRGKQAASEVSSTMASGTVERPSPYDL